MTTGKRLDPNMRMKEILDAAILLTEAHALRDITREMVADKAGCTEGLINYYFTTQDKLRDAVLKYGIKNRNLKMISEALVARSSLVSNIPRELKIKAADYLFKRG